MIRAQTIAPRGTWSGSPADLLALDAAGRRRRRYTMRCTDGLEFLLDLEHTPHLRDGDALILEDGRKVEIIAAAEPLTEIRASDTQRLLALAYHLGNRHLEAQVFADHILIRRDHVIENMVHGLGGTATHVIRPFEPVTGAYGGGHHHD